MRNRTRALESRTRVITGESVDQTYYTSDPTNITVTETPLEFSETVFSGDETTNDVVTPNFKELRAKGFIINNPYDNTVSSEEMGVLVYDQNYSWRNINSTWFGSRFITNSALDISTISGIPGHLSLDDSIDVEDLIDQAVAKAWAKTVEAPMQLGVTAAEAKKTYDMIRGLVLLSIGILQRYRNKQRLLRRGALQATKLASAWLEVRYGLRPLMYDIKSAIEAYNAIGNRRRSRYTATVVDSADSTDSTSWNAGNATYPSNYTCDRESSREYVVRAGVLTHEHSDKIDVSKAFGLGMDQLYTTAWELVPFSFVVDWFINIADLLAAWSPQVHADVLTSWVTVVRNDNQSRVITGYSRGKVPFSNPTWVWITPTTTTIRQSIPNTIITSYKERIPQPDRPAIPSLNIRLSVAKMVDILALVRGLLR